MNPNYSQESNEEKQSTPLTSKAIGTSHSSSTVLKTVKNKPPTQSIEIDPVEAARRHATRAYALNSTFNQKQNNHKGKSNIACSATFTSSAVGVSNNAARKLHPNQPTCHCSAFFFIFFFVFNTSPLYS